MEEGHVFDRSLSNQLEYRSTESVSDVPSQRSGSARALGNRPPDHDRPFFTSRYEGELIKQGYHIKQSRRRSPQSKFRGEGLPRIPTDDDNDSDEIYDDDGEIHRQASYPCDDMYISKQNKNEPNSLGKDESRHTSKPKSRSSKERDRGRRKSSKSRNRAASDSNHKTRDSQTHSEDGVYENWSKDRQCHSQKVRSSSKSSGKEGIHEKRGSRVSGSKVGSRKSNTELNGCYQYNTKATLTPTDKKLNDCNSKISETLWNVSEMTPIQNRISIDSYKQSSTQKPRHYSADCQSITSECEINMNTVIKTENGTVIKARPRKSTSKSSESKETHGCFGKSSKKKRRCLGCLIVICVIVTFSLVAAGGIIYSEMNDQERRGHLYDMVKAHVRLRVLNQSFTPRLEDTKSTDFNNLAVNFCREIDIIYLTSSLYQDYFGCSLETARPGSIEIYYVSPFLDTEHTSNVSVHQEILSRSRNHPSAAPGKATPSPSTAEDTMLLGNYLIDIKSIAIFLEKYATDKLPERPTLSILGSSGGSNNIPHKTSGNITATVTTTQSGTYQTSGITITRITTTTDPSTVLNSSNTTDSQSVNKTKEAEVKVSTGTKDESLADLGDMKDITSTTVDDTSGSKYPETLQDQDKDKDKDQDKELQTQRELNRSKVVQVLADEAFLGEATVVNCQIHTDNAIEDVTISKTGQDGATYIMTSLTGDLIKLHLLGDIQPSIDSNAFIYKRNSTVVVGLNFSHIKCEDSGIYQCSVKLVTGEVIIASGSLIGKESPGQPVLTVPGPLVENQELNTPITCTANVGFPPGYIQWLNKPKGSAQFNSFDGHFVSTSGECDNFVTSSLIYTPTREGNGTMLKCVVINDHVTSTNDLTAVAELQILPDDLCYGVTIGTLVRHPFTCTKYINCHGTQYTVLDCANQMCFDEESGKCGQISLTMPSVKAILNDGVALIRCRLMHTGIWNTMTIAKLHTSGERINILTATRGSLRTSVTLHQSPMMDRVHVYVDDAKQYEVEVNLWVELTCADSGSYVCDVNAPFHIPGAKGDIIVLAQPGAPKLTIPNQIVENLPMLQNITCEADVGFPHGTLVLKIKGPSDRDFLLVQQETSSETRNCSKMVKTSFSFLPALENNGMLIRCELENNDTLPLDHKYIAEEKMHVIPANFCLNAGDQTMREHPYDCHQYVSCLDGHIYAQRCGSNHCFDPKTLRCDRDDNTVTTFDPMRPCQPDKNGEFFQHPVLCNKFYWCVQGQEVVKHCPLGTLYIDGGQCTFEPERSMCYMKKNKSRK